MSGYRWVGILIDTWPLGEAERAPVLPVSDPVARLGGSFPGGRKCGLSPGLHGPVCR